MRNMLLLLVVLLIVAAVYYFSLNTPGTAPQVESPHNQSDETLTSVKPQPVNEADQKLLQMETRYAALTDARKKMKLRLGRLSSRLRRVEFAPDQAKVISEQMLRANYLLKNPRLLGAFSSVDDIQQEIDQLSDVNRKLDDIKQMLDEKREKNSP